MKMLLTQLLIMCTNLVAGGHSLVIALESIKSISLHSCTGRDPEPVVISARKDNSVYEPLPQKYKTCLSLTTRKNSSGLSVSNVSQYRSNVLFEWWPESANPDQGKCSVEFKGFQNWYSLSPDLGHYADCSRDLSTHRHWLAQQQPARTKPAINQVDCPITSLPNTYADYIQCELRPDTWYILRMSSTADVEYQRRPEQIERVTHTQTEHALFHTRLAVKEIHENTWMKQLVKMNLRCEKCRCELLLQKHKHWTSDLTINLYYTYNNQLDDVSMQWVANTSISASDQWREMLVNIAAEDMDNNMAANNDTISNDTMQLCAIYAIDDDVVFDAVGHTICMDVPVDMSCYALMVHCNTLLLVLTALLTIIAL